VKIVRVNATEVRKRREGFIAINAVDEPWILEIPEEATARFHSERFLLSARRT
jgi:hypothetical protein